MDPRERLSAGQLAAREGRYEEALREYVWFHDHALEHAQSLYGVRLSFALGYWMDLAQVYPEAKKELERIRDRKTAKLASGDGDRALFHDVESINQRLGAEDRTYQLFLTMLSTAPALAKACAGLAIETIVKAEDFALAQRFADSPEEALLRYSEQLNEDVANLTGDAERKRRVLDAYVHIYCNRVGIAIAILRGVGKSEEALLCREWAEALVQSERVRKRVQRLLAQRYDA
jgi:hypothetical protein